MPVVVDSQIPYVEAASIAVDAQRTEPVWDGAWKVPEPFVTFHPNPGQTPTGTSEVWFVTDARALYVYAVLADPEPDKIRAASGRRDTRFSDDFFGFYLDPAGDAQRGYLFAVNPSGVQMDGITVSGGDEDTSWDAVWTAETRRTATGYEVEMAIPWRAVRHPRDTDRVGIWLFRHVARLGEKCSWPVLDPDVQGLLVQEAVVRGPGRLPRDAGLDLLPELTFGMTQDGPVDPPIGAYGLTPGLTVRYRPTPSVSALGTFNPDFSQVESDQAQIGVNRRNALYYQEKRPFFLDGQEWFTHPFGELVYTRTIGQPYGGARVTLEPPHGTIAALYALDAAPTASVSEAGGWTEDELAGHTSSVSVLRVRRDLGSDGQVGLLLSDRTILDTDLANRLAAVDARVRISDATTASASVMGASTTFADGSSALAPAGNAEISYNSRHPYAGTWANTIAPGFRAENGYITQSDRIGGGSWAGTNFHPKSEVVPSGSITPFSVWYAWTFDGQLRDLGAEGSTHLNFGNGTGFEAGGFTKGELYADTWLQSRAGWLWFGGPWTKWLETDLNAQYGNSPYYDVDDPRIGQSSQLSGEVTLRPVPAFSIGTVGAWERFSEDGAVTYEGWVARAKTELVVTRTLSGRVLVDVNTFDDTRHAETLLAWERSPGTALYLGGSTSLTDEEDWRLFAKASWLVSP